VNIRQVFDPYSRHSNFEFSVALDGDASTYDQSMLSFEYKYGLVSQTKTTKTTNSITAQTVALQSGTYEVIVKAMDISGQVVGMETKLEWVVPKVELELLQTPPVENSLQDSFFSFRANNRNTKFEYFLTTGLVDAVQSSSCDQAGQSLTTLSEFVS
jgi:hypothetical protein